MKNKHRIKQCLSLLLAGALTFTNVGAALPAFAEDAPATPENAEAATPETAEADTTAPNLVQITENLYNDLPDAPTGSYLGSMGLPVATGETKIGISAWVSDLYDGVDTFGTGGPCEDDCLSTAVRKAYDLTPAGIIKQLNLLNPIYSRTAAGGHFGREDFPWENVEHMSDLAAYIV